MLGAENYHGTDRGAFTLVKQRTTRELDDSCGPIGCADKCSLIEEFFGLFVQAECSLPRLWGLAPAAAIALLGSGDRRLEGKLGMNEINHRRPEWRCGDRF
jgi:hypothetical protein